MSTLERQLFELISDTCSDNWKFGYLGEIIIHEKNTVILYRTTIILKIRTLLKQMKYEKLMNTIIN
jgi:hypothetical protein